MDQKSPHKVKPPFMCIACARKLGVLHENALKTPTRKDYGQQQYLNGSAGKHFDESFE